MSDLERNSGENHEVLTVEELLFVWVFYALREALTQRRLHPEFSLPEVQTIARSADHFLRQVFIELIKKEVLIDGDGKLPTKGQIRIEQMFYQECLKRILSKGDFSAEIRWFMEEDRPLSVEIKLGVNDGALLSLMILPFVKEVADSSEVCQHFGLANNGVLATLNQGVLQIEGIGFYSGRYELITILDGYYLFAREQTSHVNQDVLVPAAAPA